MQNHSPGGSLDMHNPTSLDTVCAALTYAMGIDKPKQAAIKNQIISDYVDKIFTINYT